jgi:phage tail sheath protein FI
LFVESSIQRGLRWVTFEENTPALWSLVAEHVSKFLDTLWENRFLAGTTRKDAAWVQCDRTTMTQDDIDNGRVICLVTLQPFNHQTGVLIQVLLQARGGESRSTAG